jgi:hypothetical protein
MAEILLIAAAVVAIILIIAIVVAVSKPGNALDSDRFSNARRITTGWATDAGTDMAHPAPGQPGTVDMSPEVEAKSHVQAVPPIGPEPDVLPSPREGSEVVNIRSEGDERPQRRQRRA